ncbi:MAG: hypothetical protein WEF86_08685 [Gemmatimonadota bacterium]
MNDTPGRGMIAAATAFAVAMFMFGSALVRAISIEDTPPLQPDGTRRAADDAQQARSDAVTLEALMLAVDADPFSPERQRPPERYRLPGDVEPGEEAPPAPPPVPPFQLRGTLVDAAAGGSIALIQLGEETPRLLQVGASLGGFRLTQVMPQSAIMSDGSRELMLRVPGPLQTVPIAAAPERGRRNTRDTDDDSNARERALTQQMQLVEQRRELLQMVQAHEQARQRGASPEVLEALQRAIEQRRRDNTRDR